MKNKNSNHSIRTTLFSTALAAGLAAASFAQVPPPPAPAPGVTEKPQVPPTPPAPPAAPAGTLSQQTQSVTGTVDGYNRDARGRINSIVLKSGTRLDQFNLPPVLDGGIQAIAPAGQQVTAVGVPERAVGDRTIYRTTKLTGTGGKEINVPTPGNPPVPVHVDGKITRLNFAGSGEVDGAVLDNGDFVHTGPAAAATLEIGSKLSADGPAVPMADGHQAIDATTVNGVAVPRPPEPRPRPELGPLARPTPPAPAAPSAPLAPPAVPAVGPGTPAVDPGTAPTPPTVGPGH